MEHALPRFAEPAPPAEWYNTDCGPKKTMATALQESPHRFAIMRSGTLRLHSSKRNATPFGTYNTNTAHRKDLSSNVRDGRQFCAAAFDAASLHKPPRTAAPATDAVYDVATLSSGKPARFADTIATSPVRCALMRSKQARIVTSTPSAAPDVTYPTDAFHKAGVATHMAQSTILYSSMGRSRTQRSNLGSSTACSPDVGPGSYNCPARQDVRVSPVLSQNPLSSMLSTAPRLATDKVDPTRYLGSTWKQAHDTKAWNRGATISSAEYLRPQYMPVSYASKGAV